MLHISFIKIFHIPSNLLPLICLFSSSKKSSEILFSLLSFSCGAPRGIRTPDTRFRKPLLYPSEL